jgi:hypothetical protein
MGKRNAYRVLVGKQKERDYWGDLDVGGRLIKMDLRERERGWGDMDWINLAEGRDQWRALVNTVMNLWVPKNVREFLSSCTTDSFSKRAQLHGVNVFRLQVCQSS